MGIKLILKDKIYLMELLSGKDQYKVELKASFVHLAICPSSKKFRPSSKKFRPSSKKFVRLEDLYSSLGVEEKTAYDNFRSNGYKKFGNAKIIEYLENIKSLGFFHPAVLGEKDEVFKLMYVEVEAKDKKVKAKLKQYQKNINVLNSLLSKCKNKEKYSLLEKMLEEVIALQKGLESWNK